MTRSNCEVAPEYYHKQTGMNGHCTKMNVIIEKQPKQCTKSYINCIYLYKGNFKIIKNKKGKPPGYLAIFLFWL